jgi:hypothetical protein
MEWARWLETANRHVAERRLGTIRVSTVFLGIDHSFGRGLPVLFETMIFGGKFDGYQERCMTWEQAEVMHEVACRLALGSLQVIQGGKAS